MKRFLQTGLQLNGILLQLLRRSAAPYNQHPLVITFPDNRLQTDLMLLQIFSSYIFNDKMIQHQILFLSDIGIRECLDNFQVIFRLCQTGSIPVCLFQQSRIPIFLQQIPLPKSRPFILPLCLDLTFLANYFHNTSQGLLKFPVGDGLEHILPWL